jgi:MFS family permease
MLANGTNSLIMALFFASLGFSDQRIGLFMTLTMAGDVVLGVLLTMIADKVGRRRILISGSMLMVCSGVTFALFDNFWILLFGAVVGVISIAGGDFGPFRAIEESMLSQLTTANTRSDVLAWYVSFSTLGSCIGTEAAGRIVQHLLGSRTAAESYHMIFWMYSGMGLVNLVLSSFLSESCELAEPTKTRESDILLRDIDDRSDDGLDEFPGLAPPPPRPEAQPKKAKARGLFAVRSFLAEICPETLSIMYKLWFLLAIDSIADGMTPYSLTNYYIDHKFNLAKSTLGDIQSVSYLLAAVSSILAAPLARRIGLLNTMVFTHVPSSAAVLIFPLAGTVPLTVLLFFIRVGLNPMDQAPRSAFIAGAVRPSERTAVMGITSMLRTLSATCGPTLTGLLAGNDRFWIAFVVAGVARLVYDFGLWAMFVNYKLHQHENKDTDETESTRSPRRSNDEEDVGETREMPKIVV